MCAPFLHSLSFSSLVGTGLLFRKAFLKNQDSAKRIAEPKSFRPPGLRRDVWRPNRASWHILLIQRLDSGHANPTDPVTFGNMEVQTDPISFNNDKLPVAISGRKAE